MRAFALPASEMKLADAQNFDTAMRTQFWAACADTHGLSEWRSDAGWKFRCVDKYNASGENIKISRRMTQSPREERLFSDTPEGCFPQRLELHRLATQQIAAKSAPLMTKCSQP